MVTGCIIGYTCNSILHSVIFKYLRWIPLFGLFIYSFRLDICMRRSIYWKLYHLIFLLMIIYNLYDKIK